MEILYPRCAGLDVHKDSVVAWSDRDGHGPRAARRDLRYHHLGLAGAVRLAHRDGVTHVAMEATGVYWRPVWHVLEGDFDLVLANTMHIKNVPGRKTDVNDAMWIANLLAHGLIRGSFVPPASVQARRALTRTWKQLVRERASHVQRIDKLLQDANLKLGSVLADIMENLRSARHVSWSTSSPLVTRLAPRAEAPLAPRVP